MHADRVAQVGTAFRLVERHPGGDALVEGARGPIDVLREAVGRVPIQPATAFFLVLREVPVVERRPGPDTALYEAVDESLVMATPRG